MLTALSGVMGISIKTFNRNVKRVMSILFIGNIVKRLYIE